MFFVVRNRTISKTFLIIFQKTDCSKRGQIDSVRRTEKTDGRMTWKAGQRKQTDKLFRKDGQQKNTDKPIRKDGQRKNTVKPIRKDEQGSWSRAFKGKKTDKTIRKGGQKKQTNQFGIMDSAKRRTNPFGKKNKSQTNQLKHIDCAKTWIN